MDIPATKIYKAKENQIRLSNKRPESIYSKVNVLSRLRLISRTVHEKIELYCQTVRLFAEMCELKNPFQQNIISDKLRMLLSFKYLV